MSDEAKRWLEPLLAGESLDESAAEACMGAILRGERSAPWIAGFLVALRQKGETAAEIAGFARAMRRAATEVPCAREHLVDTCGTGGDGAHSFNISTTAAFVAAGAGARVAKHGNRSVSSRCGSADVLEALGIVLDQAPARMGEAIDRIGFGFLFAPRLHSAMRHAVEPRRALGVRTVFNVLGPLTNPAGAPHQLIGVYDPALLPKLGEVLLRLGAARSLIVHGDDGLDELSVCAESTLLLVEDGTTRTLRVDPAQFGLGPHPAASLRGGDATDNARILERVLAGHDGPARDVVLLNAGAAIWACGLAEDLAAGIERARASIDSGAAAERLRASIAFGRTA